MKLITRHTDYAVSALCCIAKKAGPATVSELCTELEMPYAFLRGILQKLQKNGILGSSKGRTGGFELAKRPDKISLFRIMDIFQDTLRANGCVLKKHPCPRRKDCVLRKSISRVQNIMREKFEAITIQSLLQKRVLDK